MSLGSFVPSRPAPSPPYSSHTSQLPPNHLFASYYIQAHPNVSVETFQTVIRPKHRSLPTSPSSASSGSSHASKPSYSYPSTAPRSDSRGPTSFLAQPLAPRPPMYRAYTGYTTSPSHHLFEDIPLPAELSIFDHKPRQTLVSDLEIIFGRKFRTHSFFKSGKDRKEQPEGKTGSKESRQRRVLRKERERSWEEDFVWREVQSEGSTDDKSVYGGL